MTWRSTCSTGWSASTRSAASRPGTTLTDLRAWTTIQGPTPSLGTVSMSDFATPSAPDLTNNLRLRLAALHKNETEYPIRLTVDETEECIRVLWEFVGHMGSD